MQIDWKILAGTKRKPRMMTATLGDVSAMVWCVGAISCREEPHPDARSFEEWQSQGWQVIVDRTGEELFRSTHGGMILADWHAELPKAIAEAVMRQAVKGGDHAD